MSQGDELVLTDEEKGACDIVQKIMRRTDAKLFVYSIAGVDYFNSTQDESGCLADAIIEATREVLGPDGEGEDEG